MTVEQLQDKQEALLLQKLELIEEHSALLTAYREQSINIYEHIEILSKEIHALDKIINDACAREEALSH
jgi:hypothetical protein